MPLKQSKTVNDQTLKSLIIPCSVHNDPQVNVSQLPGSTWFNLGILGLTWVKVSS